MNNLFLVLLFLIATNLTAQNKGLPLKTQWIIDHYYIKDSAVYPSNKDCYINLNDSAFKGKANCCNFNGKFKINKNIIKITNFKSNNITCKKGKLAKLFLDNLQLVDAFNIVAAELTLYSKGEKLMVLESWR